MKLSHLTLAIFWVFSVTVEAQYGGFLQSPDGYGDPVGTPERPYTAPQPPIHRPGRYRQETTNIYQHPDDGALPEAPYITVPVGPGTGDSSYWGDPWADPW